MNIPKLLRKIHKACVASRSQDEDTARREYVFVVLVLSFLCLMAVTFVIVVLRECFGTQAEANISPGDLTLPLAALLVLYYLARRAYSQLLSYILLLLYMVLGSASLVLYGVGLAQGLLVYALALIMAGVLISARASIVLAVIITLLLLLIGYLQVHGITHPYIVETYRPFQMSDIVVLCLLFVILALVSWLSNREIAASLQRARRSERALRAERNRLELTVARRTRELEIAQLEKARDMYRFAEFGRLGASLLHDLSNPLTAVSLSFGRLESNKQGIAERHVRAGITNMEQYVQSARRQLRSQGENKYFDTHSEIGKILNFQLSRARNAKVKIYRRITKKGVMYGDDIKFHQVISNLLGNAIDSFSGTSLADEPRKIWIKSVVNTRKQLLVISVQDNGVGIDPLEINEIFRPFFSTKSSDRGLGIGLTITRQIVEDDFGGKLSVSSARNLGTTFTLEIPIKPNQE